MATAYTNDISLELRKDLTVGRKIISRGTFETFKSNPLSAKLAGGAATGSTGDTDLLLTPETAFEYHIKGTQTILAPQRTAVGLDIGMDQTDNDGVELSQGILAGGKHAYTIGTDGPFKMRVKFKIEDVSGTDDCAIGFRKAAAYTANFDDYTDAATLNVISGDIKIETILNNAATTTTDTTDNWADAATHTLEVIVTDAGVVTYLIDGVAPTVTAAFTFDNGDVVVPFMFFLHASDVAGAVEIIEWEVSEITL